MRSTRCACIISAILAALTFSATAAVPSGFFPSGQSGIVVYSATSGVKSCGDLYFIDLSDAAMTAQKLTNVKGYSPIISPDGRHVVFTSGSSNFGGTIYACPLEANATAHNLGSGYSPHWWFDPANSDVYITYTNKTDDNSFGSGNTYKRKVNLSTYSWAAGATEVKFGGSSSHTDGGFSYSFRYAAEAYRDAVLYDLQSSTRYNTPADGQACNPSICISESGEGRMMHLQIDHASWRVFGPGFSKRYAPGGSVQMPEWSTHRNYMTYLANDGAGNIMAAKFDDSGISQKFTVKSGTFTGPHMWVGSRGPALGVSPATLDFTFIIGESAPAGQDVTVSITDGSISGMSVSEDASWLNVSTSGTTLTNTISTSGLTSTQDYTTTVTVTATGAESTTYTVNLRVTEPPVLTSVDVTPASAYVAPGGTQLFSAAALDQFGEPMTPQPSFNWDATGAGTVDGSGLFTAGSAEGSATVTATTGSTSGSASVTVAETPPLHLRINAGGEAVGEWDAQQYSDGASYPFGGTHDVSGVTDPAPNEVYQTCRHQAPTYNIPASVVPNGTYTVRLHFSDGRGSLGDRAMDIVIEGQTVLTGFDIVADAGGQNIAVVKEYTVTVSDGDGLTIAIQEGSGNDAFVNGIEVISAGDAPQDPVTVLGPTGGIYSVGDTIHVQWQATVNGVEVHLSVDEGESWALLTASGAIYDDSTLWGDFPWVVAETVQTPSGSVSTVSSTCLLRVREYNGDPTSADMSPQFTILSNATVTGSAPTQAPRPAVSLAPVKGVGLRIQVAARTDHLEVYTINGVCVAACTSIPAARSLTVTARPGMYLVRWSNDGSFRSRTVVLP